MLRLAGIQGSSLPAHHTVDDNESEAAGCELTQKNRFIQLRPHLQKHLKAPVALIFLLESWRFQTKPAKMQQDDLTA